MSARRRWPLETILGNCGALSLLGGVAYALARWNVAPWAGILHGLTTLGIAWCGCNIGIILCRDGSQPDTTAQRRSHPDALATSAQTRPVDGGSS